MDLALKSRVLLLVQREIGRILSPVWIPAFIGLMRFHFGWKIREQDQIRREFLREIRESNRPVLVCANHLTMVDSFLIAWALAPPWWYILHYGKLPWNVPERRNFASTWYNNALVYLLKCIPVTRGGDRAEVSEVLKRLTYLVSQGDLGLIFPEGGRSRTGRVQMDTAGYGPGRIVNAIPDCRVLCIYMRGDSQDQYTDYPKKGEQFHFAMRWIDPKPTRKGLRGSVEVSQQILVQIQKLEQEYFDGRE